jgi:hypothetical protein
VRHRTLRHGLLLSLCIDDVGSLSSGRIVGNPDRTPFAGLLPVCRSFRRNAGRANLDDSAGSIGRGRRRSGFFLKCAVATFVEAPRQQSEETTGQKPRQHLFRKKGSVQAPTVSSPHHHLTSSDRLRASRITGAFVCLKWDRLA